MAQGGLINCKKCGTLFFKTSEREICEECFKKELDTIDEIKTYIVSTKKDIINHKIKADTAIVQETISKEETIKISKDALTVLVLKMAGLTKESLNKESKNLC